MSTPVWPLTLPQEPQLGSFSESGQGATIRTQMDVGPAKVRQRYTVEIRNISVELAMTGAQVATFDAFWSATLGYGALAFDWKDFRTQAAQTYRFTSRPSYVALGGDMWRVSFQLETMP